MTPFASILQTIMMRYRSASHTCPNCEHSWIGNIPFSLKKLRKVSTLLKHRFCDRKILNKHNYLLLNRVGGMYGKIFAWGFHTDWATKEQTRKRGYEVNKLFIPCLLVHSLVYSYAVCFRFFSLEFVISFAFHFINHVCICFISICCAFT